MTRLDIMSDPICPWCYIGKANLDRAIAKRGENPFEIDWRIFQLDPVMPPEGVDRRPHIEAKFGGPDKVREIEAQIVQAAEEAGLAMNLDQIERTPNTMDAHRLIYWSKAVGLQSVMVDRLFTDYFVEGHDISNHEVLIEAAQATGMEAEVVARLLAGDADREELRQEEETARKVGVNAVPCFILGGRYVIQGAQPVETWSKLIGELITAREQAGPPASS